MPAVTIATGRSASAFAGSRLSTSKAAISHSISADQNIAVIFNGEIYNYRALRRELADAGHVFATNGDGEVLVHGWRLWGRELLTKISGMFAFAIWDRERGELFLARDHLGVKPLYYAWHAGSFVFGSKSRRCCAFRQCRMILTSTPWPFISSVSTFRRPIAFTLQSGSFPPGIGFPSRAGL